MSISDPLVEPRAPLDHQPRTAFVGRLEIQWDPRVLEPRPWVAEQSRWAALLLTELPPGPVL